jgi:hypothetical protein
MSDAVGTIQWLKTNRFFKIPQLALGPTNFQMMPLIHHCYPGRIVTTIFKLSQSVEYYRNHLLIPYIANNATHNKVLLIS